MKERVCLVRVARMDSESGELEDGIDSGSDESQETEASDSKTGSSDDESGAEADLIQEVISEERSSIEEGSTGSTSSDQEGEKYLPKEVRPDQCTLSDSESEKAKTNDEVETSSEEWTEDSDESGYEKAYFISSAANIRRRELHGQPRYKEKTVKENNKNKLKKMKERSDQATMKDLQEEVQKGLTKDDRGVKVKNQKR